MNNSALFGLLSYNIIYILYIWLPLELGWRKDIMSIEKKQSNMSRVPDPGWLYIIDELYYPLTKEVQINHYKDPRH